MGDRANDAIRVNGEELRCKVVVEGGNLGLTQLGRIEYALSGGKINTDAIDNSAGVDCSDHEVNIKILLNSVVAEGRMNEEQRNKLLAEMTDEVGALVLRDNYFQTQSLSVRKRMPLDRPNALHQISGKIRQAQPRNRVFAVRRGTGFTQGGEDRPHFAGARGASRLQQDQAL